MKCGVWGKGNTIYRYIGFDSLTFEMPVTSLECTFYPPSPQKSI